MKLRTSLAAGSYCSGQTYTGYVEKAEWNNGYYTAVRSDDGTKRFTNPAYTTFYPNNRPLQVGERVMFTLIPEGYYSAGKISCISPAEPAAGG